MTSVVATVVTRTATAVPVVNDLRDRGVVVSTAGVHGNIVKVRPPPALAAGDTGYFLDVTADASTEVAVR
ncbi:hypothetical protein [Nocardia sp. NPDC019395]|uniref:hypothetical protein n=1 Tax=Nocardia sp. NPDC019395 TaxID=3154686 RepID=UPI0033C01DDB